jgi:surfeit locus 1 family protein
MHTTLHAPLKDKTDLRSGVAEWLPVKALFSRHWWWRTLLVLAAMTVCVLLAIWQMHRLQQRQARNAETRLMLALSPMDLNTAVLPAELSSVRYRKVTARGHFDFSQQVVLDLQNWAGWPGVHLLAPLVLDGSNRAVLVDRGWIPLEWSDPEKWAQLDEPGEVTVPGSLQMPQRLPVGAIEGPQEKWYRVDLKAIQAQMPYDLLPLYVVESPGVDAKQTPPFRQEPEIDLSNGPHLNYVIQWLCFALILGGGYVWYVGKKVRESKASA